MLEARNVTAGYGEMPVLQGLSAAFARGRVTALVGPNGCGKSTLLKAIMGFVPVSAGEIEIENQAIRGLARRTLAQRLSYLPQESHCPDYMTLGELIELAGHARYTLAGGPSEKDRALFRQSLEIVGLKDKAHCQVNALSGGQRQRAFIAMVLAQDTEVILMDEPVNHLDIKYQYAVLSLIRELSVRHGKTIVVVLHDLNLAAAFADDVVMLRAGRVVAAGPVASTITETTIARVFDLETEVFVRDGRLVCLPQIRLQETAAA
ncbi:ABC transporter ATP-binding protein [Rhizobium sp. G187]|uniref:ABC transporter ATP-binding protein n=1 Tax=Rhizobium sp. G187 TaxID=3451352 RepID=UPI003EE45280